MKPPSESSTAAAWQGGCPEKAGEAAVNLTALERLQPGAQVGDSLVVPFTAKSKTETRQYRIVGILQPQFADDTREDFLSAVPDSSLAMPEILVSSQEGGSAVNRHLVVIFSGKGGMEALSRCLSRKPAVGASTGLETSTKRSRFTAFGRSSGRI